MFIELEWIANIANSGVFQRLCKCAQKKNRNNHELFATYLYNEEKLTTTNILDAMNDEGNIALDTS